MEPRTYIRSSILRATTFRLSRRIASAIDVDLQATSTLAPVRVRQSPQEPADLTSDAGSNRSAGSQGRRTHLPRVPHGVAHHRFSLRRQLHGEMDGPGI